MRHQTKLGLRYALSRRKHFVCELDMRPVQVMLPYEGAANRKYVSHHKSQNFSFINRKLRIASLFFDIIVGVHYYDY